MKDTGRGIPSLQEWGKSLPPHLGLLTATDQNAPPQPIDTPLKDAQLSRVAGHSVVLVVAQHNFPEPCTDLGRALMLPALKLGLEGFELRDHPLLRRDPPDDKGSITDALPTEVGKTQKREGLWLSLSALLPVASGEPPELDFSSTYTSAVRFMASADRP
jgi:hypothetical protein